MNPSRFATSDDNVVLVAIGIGRAPAGNTHAGLVYRGDAGALSMLHLAWDDDLRNSLPKRRFAWVIPNIKPERALFFSRLCLNIWKRKPALPFGIRFPTKAYVDQAGNWKLHGEGL